MSMIHLFKRTSMVERSWVLGVTEKLEWQSLHANSPMVFGGIKNTKGYPFLILKGSPWYFLGNPDGRL